MIKNILLILSILLITTNTLAKECDITCPSQSINVVEEEKLINKVTGLNFASKMIAEKIIEKELKDELDSKFKANLDIFTINRLKKGEFRALDLKSKKIEYRALRMTDFYAQTLCPYNKIVYSKGRIYYPHDLAFKFKSTITNEDIKEVLNTYEFQKELERNSFSVNGVKGFEIQTPKVEILGNKLYFSIPIITFFNSQPFYINFKTGLEVSNNKIVLKDITFLTKDNIIKNDIFGLLINRINPISYEIESINTKYCKIYITNVKINNNLIKTEGTFIINKNYGEINE